MSMKSKLRKLFNRKKKSVITKHYHIIIGYNALWENYRVMIFCDRSRRGSYSSTYNTYDNISQASLHRTCNALSDAMKEYMDLLSKCGGTEPG